MGIESSNKSCVFIGQFTFSPSFGGGGQTCVFVGEFVFNLNLEGVSLCSFEVSESLFGGGGVTQFA